MYIRGSKECIGLTSFLDKLVNITHTRRVTHDLHSFTLYVLIGESKNKVY